MTARTALATTPPACSVAEMVASRILFLPALAATGLALAACFDKPINIDFDASLVDAPPPDGLSGCEPDTIVCDDDTDRYVACGSDGVAELVMDCPLGCDSDEERCVDVDPSNGLAPYLDMTDEAPSVVFTGNATLDTSTGQVFDGVTSVAVPNDTFSGIRVFVFADVRIEGTLEVSGELPLAMVVGGDVLIAGTLDVSADGGIGGPGQAPGNATCVGRHVVSNFGSQPGAGGGGRSTQGAAGGTDGGGTPGAAGGMVFADIDLVPLQGGCSGGFVAFGRTTSLGGGGGGAVQIVSRTRIAVTAEGKVDASGGGGEAGGPGGTGGGTGGAVLLEAPEVVLDGQGVVISTKGGGGSAANGAGDGNDGGTGAGTAFGGVNADNPRGGNGGTEALSPTAGGSAVTSGSGGGGGGSVGVARFATFAGAVFPQNGAALRTSVSNATLTTRLVP